jgi:hypothetical protein
VGCRIEDIVVVTADGALPVNTRPHELTTVYRYRSDISDGI